MSHCFYFHLFSHFPYCRSLNDYKEGEWNFPQKCHLISPFFSLWIALPTKKRLFISFLPAGVAIGKATANASRDSATCRWLSANASRHSATHSRKSATFRWPSANGSRPIKLPHFYDVTSVAMATLMTSSALDQSDRSKMWWRIKFSGSICYYGAGTA